MTSMIRSVSEPPIWKPTLPPSLRTVAGADQPEPLLLRQDRFPFPYFPPTTKAAVLRLGTMTMQYAFSSRSCGIPLSGAAIISEKTDAASPRRLAGSLSIANNDVVKAKPAAITSFIFLPLLSHVVVATALLVHGWHHFQPFEEGQCGNRAGQRVLRKTPTTTPSCWRWRKSESATANAGLVTESAGVALRHSGNLRVGRTLALTFPGRVSIPRSTVPPGSGAIRHINRS